TIKCEACNKQINALRFHPHRSPRANGLESARWSATFPLGNGAESRPSQRHSQAKVCATFQNSVSGNLSHFQTPGVAQASACVLSFYLTNVVIRVGRASRPSSASIHLLTFRRCTKRPWLLSVADKCTHGASPNAGRAGRPSHSD